MSQMSETDTTCHRSFFGRLTSKNSKKLSLVIFRSLQPITCMQDKMSENKMTKNSIEQNSLPQIYRILYSLLRNALHLMSK